MSGDEVFASLFFLLLAAIGVRTVFVPLLMTRTPRRWWGRWAIASALIGVIISLWETLQTSAAAEVRHDAGYIALFLIMGLACEALILMAMPLLGINLRDDALERSNGSAVLAACGAIIGCGAIVIGGNIGEGNTIWSTIGPVFLAMAIWGVFWTALEFICGVSEAVTVERDIASGLRLGALLAANGLILGRAIAGDWQSFHEFSATLLHHAGPIIPLTIAAALAQLGWRPRLNQRRSPIGPSAIFSAFFVSAAAAWVWHLGPC